MSKLNIIKEEQLTANSNLVLDSLDRPSIYILNGGITLTTNVDISLASATVIEGTEIVVYYKGSVIVDGNVLTLFGTNISDYALQEIKIDCIYIGGSWNYTFSNYNTFELTPDSISTAQIQDDAITTDKVIDGAISPSKLQNPYEVETIEIDLAYDSVSNRVVIPYYATLESIRFYCTESFDTAANKIEFDLNIDGSGTTTAYPRDLVSVGIPLVKGDSGLISTSPTIGVDTVGVVPNSYVQITLTQTSTQLGKITFFLVLKRKDV